MKFIDLEILVTACLKQVQPCKTIPTEFADLVDTLTTQLKPTAAGIENRQKVSLTWFIASSIQCQ